MFFNITDEFSKFCMLYLLNLKVPDNIIEFVEATKTQSGRKPNVVHSDQAAEYTSKRLQFIHKPEVMQVHFQVAYSPQQNSAAA